MEWLWHDLASSQHTHFVFVVKQVKKKKKKRKLIVIFSFHFTGTAIWRRLTVDGSLFGARMERVTFIRGRIWITQKRSWLG
jgi:hypothetical protein